MKFLLHYFNFIFVYKNTEFLCKTFGIMCLDANFWIFFAFQTSSNVQANTIGKMNISLIRLAMIEEINSRNISVLLISNENRISFTALPPSFPIQLPYLIQETFSWRDGQRCSHHSFLPLISRVRGNSGERRTINHSYRNLCARRRLSTNGVGEIYYLEESWACIADIHKISGVQQRNVQDMGKATCCKSS